MTRSKYGKYLYKRLIKKSPHPEITAPMASLKAMNDSGGVDIAADWCCISQPVTLHKKAVIEKVDRFLVFAGGDPLNPDDFKAEVEISLGLKGAKYKLEGPRVVFIPQGLAHYPLTVTRVEKPIVLLNIAFASQGVREEIADCSGYITAPSIGLHDMVTRTYRDEKLIREQKMIFKELVYAGKDAAGGGLTLFWFPVAEPHIMYEPPHSHDHSMLAIFLGGNPLNVGEFGAELDMWLGEEGEKHTVRSTSAVYHPSGLVHRHVDFQKVDKPFQEIHIFRSPEYIKARTLEGKS